MKKITWAMIGAGVVTEVKSGPGLYKSEGSKLKGVYDVSKERTSDYCNRHHLEKAYESVEEILADDEIEIVYIATPPVTHKDYVLRVLEAKKIPYVEKPVAMNYKEALEIEEASKKAGIPVFVSYYRRGLEKHIKIKEMIENKVLGEPRYVRVLQSMRVEDSELDREKLPWRVKYEVSGGGKFFDMAVHVLDYLQFYFGDLKSLDGLARNLGNYYDVEDTVSATFEFENSVVGSGMWCYVADIDQDIIEIVFDKGRIVTSGLGNDSAEIHKNGVVEYLNFDAPEHIAMPYQQSVVNELLGKSKSNNNFKQAILPLKMIDKLYEPYFKK